MKTLEQYKAMVEKLQKELNLRAANIGIIIGTEYFTIFHPRVASHQLAITATDETRLRAHVEGYLQNVLRTVPGYSHLAPGYDQRVEQLEAEGLTTSDAQGCADAEVMQGKHTSWTF